jgi:site-specific DNA-methyltransferase (adenine-specific)
MLLQGDCLDRLKDLEDNSVDSIVTDPPYGLSFMNKKWDYDVPTTEIWEECLRVLKPGGHLLSFSSARTYHRMVVNVEDAGFEIRDQIMWVYGSGFPKNHNIGKALNKKANYELDTIWDGWGTALKPSHEPIVMARKPFKGTVVDNVLEHGTGGINIDASRVTSDNNPMKWETPRGGIWSTDSEATAKLVENIQGRFPANFIHDGSQEVLDLFPDSAGSGGSVPQTKVTGYGDKIGNGKAEYIGGPRTKVACGSGSAARFFYCAKANKKERNAGCEDLPDKEWKLQGLSGSVAEDGVSNKNGTGTVRGVSKNNHPTVKPIKLMTYLINLVTPPDGTVLDPFMGSGSTGVACKTTGNPFIGIERDPEYFTLAQTRIN